MPQGKALDLSQASAVEGHDRRIHGTNDYKDIAGAAIVVVTAGLPRKPGMSREDLLSANARIILDVCGQIKRFASEAIVIIVTNPLDLMTHLAHKTLGFPRPRVIGMAGVLDTARMRYFLAERLDAVPRDVEAVVLGGHGDLMVPVSSQSRHKGKDVKDLIGADDLARIEQRTRDGGAEIVQLLKTGSAFYAPASSAAQMAKAILKSENRVLPVCTHLAGEYGIQDLFFGVPAEIGAGGVRRVVELPLAEAEKRSLLLSAQKVRQGVEDLGRLGF
ncbi:MAG: hypothetical protein A3D28_01960 [Omnitrophica bacterium RIFCSPHIGHO2_02_FULL_63_14]|nr:MAG: hypothetical protein A3D28_01960 [Omnitrophica bacterium RIFCSPHIGHO2_02_FULL_63_14]